MLQEKLAQNDNRASIFAQEAFHKSCGGMIEPKSISALVIEDSDTDYRIIKKTLKLLDTYRVDVHHARNLVDARAEISSNKPFDIVLVDFCLGVETGSRVIQELGGRAGHSAVLLVTGMPGQDILEIALETGALGYINKNQISPSLLESAIRSAMHTHALELRMHDLICNLEQANRTTADVVAQIFRDLGVPVAALRQCSEAMESDTSFFEASRSQREFLAGVRKSTEHISRLLSDLDDRHRDRRSATLTPFEVCAFNTVVRNAVDLAEPLIHEAGHTVNLSLDGGRPATRCQPEIITQTILSLIANAIGAIGNDGLLSIEVTMDVSHCHLRIAAANGAQPNEIEFPSISDNGSESLLGSTYEDGMLGIRDVVEVHEGKFALMQLPDGGNAVSMMLPLAS